MSRSSRLTLHTYDETRIHLILDKVAPDSRRSQTVGHWWRYQFSAVCILNSPLGLLINVRIRA